MKSCIYEGWVRHRRFFPAYHEFKYRLFYLYLDLDELADVFHGRLCWSVDRFNLAWFRRGDHLGNPKIPLSRSVRDLVETRTGQRPQGPIRLLTHLRYFGYCMNPVSFYYCFDPSGARVETIVAEVHNTPWGEMHCYVLNESLNDRADSRKRFRFNKDFHVSPFLDMDHLYDWRFTEPGQHLSVHMENLEKQKHIFDATMVLNQQSIGGKNLSRVLLRYPFMTGKVIAAIYWQALRLWLKRCPFFVHPRKRSHSEVEDS